MIGVMLCVGLLDFEVLMVVLVFFVVCSGVEMLF